MVPMALSVLQSYVPRKRITGSRARGGFPGAGHARLTAVTETPSLEERVAALEATVAMLVRKLLANGDITINDARATHGLPPFPEEIPGAA